MTSPLLLHFDHRFLTLGDRFYTAMPAEGIGKKPYLIHANAHAAQLIGLPTETFHSPEFLDYFSGNQPLPGSHPLAMVYSGHQFGQWAGQLGDGRALLLGQVRNTDGDLWDIQLKGGGKTPYSRFGDGRAVVRSCIREYLCSEAMHALGIPTSRALSIVGTGESVQREIAEPGAVFTRLAQSHIRFGHFEHFYYRKNHDELKALCDHVIAEYFPHHTGHYDRWFAEVVSRTASMIAQWQAVGFCHGVMNTDNMSILGLTLDYGPFGFMEAFDLDYVCNHSDHSGRYSYDQQPMIGRWNCHALAHALSPIIPTEITNPILAGYDVTFNHHYSQLMRQKIGIAPSDSSHDDLWIDLLTLMASQRSDYSLTFRYLADSFTTPHLWTDLFRDPGSATEWLTRYHHTLRSLGSDDQIITSLNGVNPRVVLRNWVAESAIRSAEDGNDYSEITQILQLIQTPYNAHLNAVHYGDPAPDHYLGLQVSCSS